MPFKSEKQRRYLWANEPEIARDWADTYGSKIKKAEGGITRIGFRRGGPQDWGAEAEAKQKGSANVSKDNPYSDVAREENRRLNERVEANRTIQRLEEDKKEEKVETFRHKNINNPLYKAMKHLPYIGILNKMAGPFGNRGFFLDKVLKAGHYMTDEEMEAFYNDPSKQEEIYKEYMRARGSGIIDAYGRKIDPTIGGEGGQGYMGYPSYAAWQAAQQRGGDGGINTVAEEVVETQSPFQKSLNTGIAQAPSPYYVGANPTAANIAWGQQFGVDPRTMYLAEGGPIRQRYFLGKLVKKIGRAAKKIVKSPVGKMALLGLGAYGLGGAKFLGGQGIFAGGQGMQRFANLKNLKDVTGFKQLLTGGGKDDKYDGEWNPWKLGIAGLTAMPFLMGTGKKEEEGETPFDYQGAKQAYLNEIMKIKRDAMAGTLDPSQFVYQGIKDGGRIGYAGGGSEDPMLIDEYKKYVFEMEEQGLQPMSFEEFKAQALAGMASGGRAGYYAGGQSIPSENSMEDARKTAMQDRLGGITEVMKQADLYRQGDVGQMYMAEGGPTQEAGIMDLGGVEKDYRETGGFVPIGKEEKADDVPARLSLNEFVMTADAVRGMGEGDIDKGAERMEDLMDTLEVKGKKNQGAQDMFEVSERLSAVV